MNALLAGRSDNCLLGDGDMFSDIVMMVVLAYH
jgi:hypothetical protein